MSLYDVPAPAKINLFLHVTGRRPDGYHLLQTVFRFIDFCDCLDFDVRADGQIHCDNGLPGLAHDDDLVVRAARLLQQATGTRQGAQIHCRKHIPAGAGLGGGSSDAATTLIALDRLWGTGLGRDALMRIGAGLGADVPVFLFGQPAFAEGIGDVLSPVSLPDRAYLIARPACAVPTASIFSSQHLTRDTPCVTMSIFADWQKQQAVPALFGRNDLEAVAMAAHPEVAQVGALLGLTGHPARMTGSGSCFFVEFATLAQARLYQQEVAAKMAVEGESSAALDATWVCQGLSQHPLFHWINH